MLCIAFCVVVSAFQGSKLCAVSPMNAARLARTENQNLIWICCVRCCDRVCSTLTLQIFNGWPFHFFAWSYFCTFVGLFFVFSVCLSWLNKFSDGALVETVTECTCTCVCISVNVDCFGVLRGIYVALMQSYWFVHILMYQYFVATPCSRCGIYRSADRHLMWAGACPLHGHIVSDNCKSSAQLCVLQCKNHSFSFPNFFSCRLWCFTMRYCSFAVGTPSLCFGFVFWQLWWEKWLTQRIPQAMLEKTPPPPAICKLQCIWAFGCTHCTT